MSQAQPLTAPPAPAFTLSEDASRSVKIVVTIPAGATRLWLERYSPSGAQAWVRGAQDLTVSPSTVLTIFDYEVPIGVALQYNSWAGNAGGEISATPVTHSITLASAGCSDTWLTNLTTPNNTVQLPIEYLEQLLYTIPTGVHKVIGRRAPIVASDLAGTPAFDVALLTATDLEREQVRATLGEGVTVLLRTGPELDIGNLFFAVLGWAEQRIVRDGTVSDRRFVVQGQEVERPDAKLFVPPTLMRSYLAVHSENADYAEAKAAYATYDAMRTTYGGDAGYTVEPWPPDDA